MQDTVNVQLKLSVKWDFGRPSSNSKPAAVPPETLELKISSLHIYIYIYETYRVRRGCDQVQIKAQLVYVRV